MAIIHSTGLADKLIEAGIVPKNARRVIIDIQVDNVLKVYYDVFGDDRLLSLDWTAALDGADVIHVTEKDDG